MGLQHLTARRGGSMVWASTKLLLAGAVIQAAITLLPLTLLMWLLMIGTL